MKEGQPNAQVACQVHLGGGSVAWGCPPNRKFNGMYCEQYHCSALVYTAMHAAKNIITL